MKDNGSKEDCFDQIFLMDEDITPLDYPEHNESKFLQMIQKINIMLPSHPSSNSIFSNSSASNSRPSSRLGSLTTNSSALSTPRPLNRQCHTPSPYFWQASVPTTPTHPITDDDIALSFRDIFEDSDFLSLNKPLNDISDEESDLEKTESEESETESESEESETEESEISETSEELSEDSSSEEEELVVSKKKRSLKGR